MTPRSITVLASLSLLGLTSCATPPSPPALPTASPTPDPCNSQNIRITVALVNDRTRQFDDYSILASNIVQAQVVLVIPPMQEIRRAAEDQAVPACLVDLKRLQVLYMNSALDALLAFQASTDADKLAAAIVQSRAYHEQYAIELARVLGVTLTPPTPAPTAVATP